MLEMKSYEEQLKAVIDYAIVNNCNKASLHKVYGLLMCSILLPENKSDYMDNCQPTVCQKHGDVSCDNVSLNYENFYCLKCICEFVEFLIKNGEFEIAKLQWKEKTNGTLENCAGGKNNETPQGKDL